MKIYNLTQHPASPEQVAVGVVDLEPKLKAQLKELLTFEELPSSEEIETRATKVVELAKKVGGSGSTVMIGGADWFTPVLALMLADEGIKAVHAFTKREVVEKDGVKTSVFKHLGFIESPIVKAAQRLRAAGHEGGLLRLWQNI